MVLIKKLIFTILIICFLNNFTSHAQEVIKPLSQVRNLNLSENTTELRQSIMLDLPFFDDFSNEGNNFNATHWDNKGANKNRTTAICPPSIGTATFDGLNESGFPHGNSLAASADTLTSKTIDLSNLSPSDSVFISFYYQNGGLSDLPESSDSLILEFYNETGNWMNFWDTTGNSLSVDSLINSKFNFVILPFLMDTFFHTEFKFRFRNYGDLTGLFDVWNVDYLYINSNRDSNDSTYVDVAFVDIPTDFTSPYSEIPYNTFFDNPTYFLDGTQNFEVFNHSTIIANTGYDYDIFYLNNEIDNFIPSANNSAVFAKTSFAFNNLPSSFPSATSDEVFFDLEYRITPGQDLVSENDIVKVKKRFGDVYAYDDCSAEAAYTVEGSENGDVAYAQKYNLPPAISETIYGVMIYFAQAGTDESDNFFDLHVYENIDSLNETILYTLENNNPEYRYDNKGYAVYEFDPPLTVTSQFYIGLEYGQTVPISVGFDRNKFNNENQLFKTNGIWKESILDGTFMIRPIVKPIDPSIIMNNNQVADLLINDIKIGPNPVNDVLNITTLHNEIESINIYNLAGNLIQKNEFSKQINIQNLEPGVYIIEFIHKNKNAISNKKFIKL